MRGLGACLAGVALVSLVLSSGCASIVAGGPDRVRFDSNPQGALVSVDGAFVGRTPVTASVDRGADEVSFKLEGYEPVTMPIDRSLNGWVFGNIIFGGLIGLVVDLATGNVTKASPEMAVSLSKAGVGTEGLAGTPESQSAEGVSEVSAP